MRVFKECMRTSSSGIPENLKIKWGASSIAVSDNIVVDWSLAVYCISTNFVPSWICEGVSELPWQDTTCAVWGDQSYYSKGIKSASRGGVWICRSTASCIGLHSPSEDHLMCFLTLFDIFTSSHFLICVRVSLIELKDLIQLLIYHLIFYSLQGNKVSYALLLCSIFAGACRKIERKPKRGGD